MDRLSRGHVAELSSCLLVKAKSLGTQFDQVQRGEPVTLKLVRKYQFLNIICFDNIQSTSLEMSDVV